MSPKPLRQCKIFVEFTVTIALRYQDYFLIYHYKATHLTMIPTSLFTPRMTNNQLQFLIQKHGYKSKSV